MIEASEDKLFFPPMAGFVRSAFDVGVVPTVVYRIGEGRPLVFLHGAGTFPGFEFARRIAAKREIVIPYHPGFGESGGDGLIGDMADLVGHYEAAFKIMGFDSLDLAGFSLGGWIAAEYAARNPDSVRRLALVAPGGLIVEENPAPDLSKVRPDELAGYLTHDPEVAAAFFPKHNCPAFGNALGREMVALDRLLQKNRQGNPNLPELLGRISSPTFLMWGQNDRMQPFEQAKAWLSFIRNAKLKSFANTGHLLVEERPDAAEDLAQFFQFDR